MSDELWGTYKVQKEVEIRNGERKVVYEIRGNSISGTHMCRKDVEVLIELLTKILEE